MFEDLREAFKEALDNFNKELSRENVSGTADKLLAGMKDEIAEQYGVDMPITAAVAAVVDNGRTAAEAYKGLLEREVGHEVEYGS